MLFADDQILLQESENELQKSIHLLQQIARGYNMQISIPKTKTMAFKGKYPVRIKILIDGQTIEQVEHYKYLGCDVSYDKDKDITNKLCRFQRICGTIKRQLKNKTRKETKTKILQSNGSPYPYLWIRILDQ